MRRRHLSRDPTKPLSQTGTGLVGSAPGSTTTWHRKAPVSSEQQQEGSVAGQWWGGGRPKGDVRAVDRLLGGISLGGQVATRSVFLDAV